MAERSNAAVLKTVRGESLSRVRIPVSPPVVKHFHELSAKLISKMAFYTCFCQ